MYAPAIIAQAEARLQQVYAGTFPQGFYRYPAAQAIEQARLLDRLKRDDGTLDPDKPLTAEQQRFILNEQILSKVDYRYFAERYVKVNKEGQELAPLFPLWESQELILADLARIESEHQAIGHPDGVLFNILKARQLGASTLTQSLIAHRVVTTGYVKALIASDTPDNSGSDGLFGMLELVVEHVPWWLKPSEKFHTKNKHIVFANHSIVRVESGKSMKGGLTEEGGSKGQMGRSKTYSAAHLSELSTWEHPEQIDDSLLPAIPRTPRTLVGFESTAKGRANWWHQHWQSAVRGRGRFSPIFIPWYAEKRKYWLPAPAGWVPATDTLDFAKRAELSGPKFMHRAVTLSREQLYWYESMKLDFVEKGALYKFLEEYPADPEEAFQYSGRSIFPIAVRERIRAQAKPILVVLEVKARAALSQMTQAEVRREVPSA